MTILKDMTTEEAVQIASRPNPPHQVGEWTLTAPDGQQWKADSPAACLMAECDSRIPAIVQLARIRCGIDGVDWHDDESEAA